MNLTKRNLPNASEIIEATGLTVTYLFDDLIFVEQNPFLLRFNDKNPSQIFIHFNQDCYKKDKTRLHKLMEAKACEFGMEAILCSAYTMVQKDNDEIEISFESR